jgi:hypothetical protein
MDDNRVTYFAATDSRGKRTPFGIKASDRRRHMYVIGKTGMGKSTLLENMAIQDIRNGEGLAFIDPHGGTADTLLEYIPEHRLKDVIYFAPFDLQQPIAFNVMEDVGYDKRHLVVSGLMATFKKIWVDAWSARMEYILSNTLLALLEYPGSTLLSVNRMYTDKNFRKRVVDNVKDPVVKDFWVKEFANYGDRYTQEATPAIQNKIGQFTSNPLIRNIIGQPKSSFDIREAMDSKKIIIINLSKGQVGETNMRLLGSMLTTRLFLGAMSRADLHRNEINKLPDFYFYVDEFQNFANETFAEILSEARKYKLNLVIAHQYVEQMDEEVRAAVFGNVGTTISFRVGPFDAETLETVYMPEFTKEDLVNLTFAQIYLTLMIDGVGSRPFSAITLPPIEPPSKTFRDEAIASSRNNFGAARDVIESQIMEELTSEDTPDPNEEAKKNVKPSENRSPERRPTAPSESRPQIASRPAPREASSGAPRASQESRSSSPRPQTPRPEPKAKTSEDLKAILRSMTAQAPKKEEQKSSQSATSAQSGSLKSALSDILKQPAPQSSALRPQQRPQPSRQLPPPHMPKQLVPEAPRAEAPKADSRKPFEVPEETLKALFRDQ